MPHAYAFLVLAAAGVFPFVTRAFFPDELRKLHAESVEQRDSQREQFRQDVLEKRKEMLSRWHDRKEEFKNRLKGEQDRIRPEFEIRRTRGEELSAAASTTPGIQNQTVSYRCCDTSGEVATSSLISVIARGAKDIVRALFPFGNLFGN